jgi:FkbM family methyltransferase
VVFVPLRTERAQGSIDAGSLTVLTRRLATALPYYLGSVPTLAFGSRNPFVLLRLLRRGGPTVELQLRDGTRFLLRTLLDAWVVKETVLDRVYESFDHQIGADWTILDIGAGLGDFSVSAARRAVRGHVHAYEPAAGSAALLRRNLELNGIANVTVYEEAVAGTSGDVFLEQDVPEAVMFKLSSREGGERGGSVAAVTLEEAMRRLPAARCDLLKMDCEGSEYEILLGAEPALLDRIDRISIEYHDFDHADRVRELADRLRSLGRSVRLRPSEVYEELGYLHSQASSIGRAAR